MSAHLGELEQLVLLALLRLGPEAYGVSVRRELQARTGRDVALGSVYKTLERLEDKGYVASRLGDPTSERGGRRKRHYELRPAGQRALDDALTALRRMLSGLEARLEPERS